MRVPPSLIAAELHGASAAIKHVFGRLGLFDMFRLFVSVAADQAHGEPWRELGFPVDRKEFLSRRQLGSAVLLDRNLRELTDPETARELTGEIVREASVEFLSRNVPALRKNKVLQMTDSQRHRFFSNIQEKFFNADADITFRDDDELRLTVTRCRFVELLDEIGERDMAPLFCEGDRVFFDEHQPETIFERPEKISSGGKICDFRFSWKNE